MIIAIKNINIKWTSFSSFNEQEVRTFINVNNNELNDKMWTLKI